MICNLCNKEFPRRIIVDGIVRNFQWRKYCIECSPFGAHNTCKLSNSNPRTKTCQRCGKVLCSRKRKGNYCASCYITRWRQKTKKQLSEYKGGKCTVCGYNRCIDNLTFHHLDPSKKDFNISSSNVHSFEKIKKEADKCKLLCCRCHGEVHAGLLTL
jgi:hypothetical protein